MDPSQLITLTPDQYATINGAMRDMGGSRQLGATPVNGSNGITGYQLPYANYNSAYTQATNYGMLERGNGLPLPSSFSTPAAAQPAGPPPNPNMTTPTYAQFQQQFANRASPVTFNGGAAPAGMNASDAALLQSIYTPGASGVAPPPAAAKATGGFVDPNAAGQQFADGGAPGMLSGSDMGTWVTRREATDATHTSGLFNSPVPGRTDKLDTMVPAGAYVVPADVVSGLGEGNTMAGSAVLDKMFHSNPFGIQDQRLRGGAGVPHAPAAYRQPRAAGGPTNGHVPIVAAGGEYLIHPSAVRALGGGNIKKGHKILDHFVLHARKNIVKETSKLPGPKK